MYLRSIIQNTLERLIFKVGKTVCHFYSNSRMGCMIVVSTYMCISFSNVCLCQHSYCHALSYLSTAITHIGSSWDGEVVQPMHMAI